MTLTKLQKEELLANLKNLFQESTAAVASDYSGLPAVDMTVLRRELKSKNISFIVTKNSLVKKALDELGIDFDLSILDRPVAFAFGDDEIELCKILSNFAKAHEGLQPLGGIIAGNKADVATIRSLALLPSREELQGQLVGVLASPSRSLVYVLRANVNSLINVLRQYGQVKS